MNNILTNGNDLNKQPENTKTQVDNEYIELFLNWIEAEEREEYQFFIETELI